MGTPCPRYIAATGTKLAIAPSCGILTIIDLAGDRTPVYIHQDLLLTPVLNASPAMPGIVVAAETAMTSHDLYVLDISGPTPVVLASELHFNGAAKDIALSPDGATILVGDAGSSSTFAFNTADLSVASDYAVDSSPSSVAWAADGASFIAVTTQSVVPTDQDLNVHLFDPAKVTPEWQYASPETISFRGVAIAPDASRFFLVTISDGSLWLWVRDVGVNPGSLSGTIAGADHFPLDQPHVDLFDGTGEFLFTTDAAIGGEQQGRYAIDRLEPGNYYVMFWNGNDTTLYDFFPEWYNTVPLYRGSVATQIAVGNGEHVTGIDAMLRWFYADMFGNTFEADIFWLGNTGITKGCNPPTNTLYCPEDVVTRGQMAAFLVRALGLTDTGTWDFVDDDNSIFESDIEKLAAAGITRGCNPPTNDRFCPEDGVTRGQMAAFLVRALGLTDTGTWDFVDDDNSIFEAAIEKLAAAGITKGCNPPTNDHFCPDAPVTRGQMAAFLKRALTG